VTGRYILNTVRYPGGNETVTNATNNDFVISKTNVSQVNDTTTITYQVFTPIGGVVSRRNTTDTLLNGIQTVNTVEKNANGQVIVNETVTSYPNQTVVFVNNTDGNNINGFVSNTNSDAINKVTTTNFTNGTFETRTIPSPNGTRDQTIRNIDFPSFQSGPLNYAPNPFNTNPIAQGNSHSSFTPTYYSNYYNNDKGGLNNYINMQNPLDPHELYFDEMKTEAIYLWVSCGVIFLLLLILLLAYCCGCLGPRARLVILTIIIIIWFAMAVVLLLRYKKNMDLEDTKMPLGPYLGFGSNSWRSTN